MNLNLAHGFRESSVRFPDHLALSVGNQGLSYIRLCRLVQPFASWLRSNTRSAAPKVGILASRSLSTYVGILGTCWAGGVYVPMSTKLPEDRLIQLLGRVQADVLVVDAESLPLLSQRVLPHCPALILSPDLATSVATPHQPNTTIAGRDALPAFDPRDQPVPIESEDLAYIIFTSGTTGIPKGVMITVGAVAHFVSVMQARYALEPSDRVAGMTETTFDIS